jgi:hypothetical protein
MKYTPKIKINPNDTETSAAFVAHFKDQMTRYGRQLCVNLVNQSGTEGKLEQAYANQVQQCSNSNGLNIRYEAFDFHTQCAKMKFQNVNRLIDTLADDFKAMGYLSATYTMNTGSSQKPVYAVRVNQRQASAIRTNCIDCLDRTGVAQSVFARHVLAKQMQALGLIESDETKHTERNANLKGPEFPAQIEAVLKQRWADNADALSLQYAGTGALKSDYTRTGKRTRSGALEDLQKSLTRYYKNNFLDGFNQDSVDLFLGLYIPSLQQPSPFSPAKQGESGDHVQKPFKTLLFSLALVSLSILLVWSMIAPRGLAPYVGARFTVQLWCWFALFSIVTVVALNKQGKHYATKRRFLPAGRSTTNAASVKF